MPARAIAAGLAIISPKLCTCISTVPSCASPELLNENLRDKWGFNGYVTVRALATLPHFIHQLS